MIVYVGLFRLHMCFVRNYSLIQIYSYSTQIGWKFTSPRRHAAGDIVLRFVVF